MVHLRIDCGQQSCGSCLHRICDCHKSWCQSGCQGAGKLRFLKSAFSLRSLAMPTPTAADRTCPMIVFRGWASGDSMALNSKIAAAPWTYQHELRQQDPQYETYEACNEKRGSIIFNGRHHESRLNYRHFDDRLRTARPATSMLPIFDRGLSRCPRKWERGLKSLDTRLRGMYGLR